MTKGDEICKEMAEKYSDKIKEAADSTAAALTDDESERARYAAVFMLGATMGLSLATPGAIEMLKRIKKAHDEGDELSKVMVLDGREEVYN